MGLIAKLLSFTRRDVDGVKLSDVKVDPGGGANITGEHFAGAGDDSHPLDSDYAAVMPIRRGGGAIVVAYADPLNEPKAAAGDKRIYGRDAAGAAVNEVWLKADGSVIMANSDGTVELRANGSIVGSNSSGDFELESGGDFVANGAKMKTDGDVETSDGVSLRNHVHVYTWTDPGGSGSTNPPT